MEFKISNSVYIVLCQKGRMTLRIIIALTCLYLAIIVVMPFQAVAAQWKLFFKSVGGSKVYIDTSSIVHLHDNRVRAWEKTENADGNAPLVVLQKIDCKERKIVMRQFGIETLSWLHDPNSLLNEWSYLDTSDLDERRFKIWCEQSQ